MIDPTTHTYQLRERKQQPITTLTVEKERLDHAENDVYTFSLWIELDGNAIPIYFKRVAGNIAEAWIQSQENKVRVCGDRRCYQSQIGMLHTLQDYVVCYSVHRETTVSRFASFSNRVKIDSLVSTGGICRG
jgi:hypothetical protein